MTPENALNALKNFMGFLDTPAGRLKYGNDRWLMECVQYAKDHGFEFTADAPKTIESVFDFDKGYRT